MKSQAQASRSPMIASILANLVGIDPSRYAAFETALQSNPIMPMVMILIAIRFRRLVVKLAYPLTSNAGRLLGGWKGNAESDRSVSNVAASTGAMGEGQALSLPREIRDGSFPKVLFQTWKSKASMPENYARWSESFKRKNPDFEYFLWDDLDNRCFIERHYPWFLPIYDAYPREIYRADAVRYFFLYQFGGLYADMDTECLKPVAPLFGSGDVWLGRMGQDPAFPHSIPNAIMASRPLQEFWLLAIHFLIENAKALGDPQAMAGKGPESMTGPILLKQAYDTYTSSDRSRIRELVDGIAARLPPDLRPRKEASRVEVLPPEIWYPIDWSNMIHLRLSCEVVDFKLDLGDRTKHWLFPDSFLVTYWSHSWKPATPN